MSVAESTARLMNMPEGTPRVVRMDRTETFRAGASLAGAAAVPAGRRSMRHSEVQENAARAAETNSATALVRAIAPSCPETTRPAAMGPMSWPSEAPMVKWPKLRSCSSGALWRATMDWAPMTNDRWPSPITPLHAAIAGSDPAVPLNAQPVAMRATPMGSSGAHRPWSVRRPSGTAANSGSRA